jgi:hypothetical protein
MLDITAESCSMGSMENAPISLEYSAEALMGFLDYLAKKGLVNSNTIISRKAASNKMLAILSPGEAADLRQVDLDQLATRFANLKGKDYSPQSLQVYKSRVATSLEDFFRYKENPANFKVGSSAKKTASGVWSIARSASNGRIVVSRVKKGAERPVARTEAQDDERSRPTVASAATINFPVPLRPNCVVQINGLPVDLTKAEAAKIAAVVSAMISVS